MDERRRGVGRGRWQATRPVAWIGIGLVALASWACESATERPPQISAPTSERAAVEGRWTARSEGGRFRITVRPEDGRVPIGPLQAWIVEVATPEGRPADVRQLVFDGGMPQHGHGFETKPTITDVLGPGVFRVDGIRFHMAGSWRLRVDVADATGADVAYFDIDVAP